MNFCRETNFVRINISDSGNKFLIEQKRFQPPFFRTKNFAKFREREIFGKRLDSEFLNFGKFFEIFFGNQSQRTKFSNVGKLQPRPAGKFEKMADGFFERNRIFGKQKMSRHPKMDEQFQFSRKRKNDEFRAAANRENFFVANLFFEFRKRGSETFFRVARNFENFLSLNFLEIANLRFDFGQFGHGINLKCKIENVKNTFEFYILNSKFKIIPAIDLIRGKCVRLYKGSFEQKTEYFISPAEQASIFEEEEADLIHIVDLDGAKIGEPKNLRTIAKIREAVKIPIEVGGGIRSIESAEKLFKIGVDRIILGTLAVEQPELLKKFLAKFGAKKIVVGLDAREGGLKLATRGWRGETNLEVIDFAEELAKIGVRRIIFTDIARDGTLTFPNFDVNERLVKTTNLKIIASGGVTDIEHLRILRRVGCEGAILGKAIYENEISVAEIKMNLKF